LKTHRLLALVLVIMVLPTVSLEGADKRVRIQRGDLVGTWIGLTTDELQMIRLTLGPQGDGIIGVSFMDEEPCVFRLASWTFDTGEVALDLADSLGRCPRDREFHGVAKGNALELTVRGAGWKRSASLRKEERLVDRWQRLKAAMNPGS
jgi:hypothetical protein